MTRSNKGSGRLVVPRRARTLVDVVLRAAEFETEPIGNEAALALLPPRLRWRPFGVERLRDVGTTEDRRPSGFAKTESPSP